MLENLQVGDIIQKGEEKRRILAVCGELVGLSWNDNHKLFGGDWRTPLGLEREGWQLEKKKWVPKSGERYYFATDDGLILGTIYTAAGGHLFRLETKNYFETIEEAEAYRNKLVEVMGREGV